MSKSDRKAAVQKLKTLVMTPKAELESFRNKLEKNYSTVFLPNHVEKNERDYGGVKCDYLVPEIYSSRRIMLYVHGGSFVGGSRDSWRNFCSSLANAASCRVVVPEFRLPPTHPFPAGIEDIHTVFRMLYAEEQVALELEKASLNSEENNQSGEEENAEDEKKKLPQIIIAADGSGSSLALALLQKLSERYLKAVSLVYLISPWLNLTSDCELIAGKKIRDEVISGEDLHRAVDLYTYAANLSNPLVSPLKAEAESFRNFPPFFIQLGEKEILLQQARQLCQKLEDAGVECMLDVWPEMIYMFQMADEYLPEAHLAIEKIGKYISRRESLTEAEEAERQRVLLINDIRNDF